MPKPSKSSPACSQSPRLGLRVSSFAIATFASEYLKAFSDEVYKRTARFEKESSPKLSASIPITNSRVRTKPATMTDGEVNRQKVRYKLLWHESC